MPFGDLHTPSLALSLLHAELRDAGVSSTVHYFSIPFAEKIGIERYDAYTGNLSGAFLGEWIFSDCLFPRGPEETERFVEEVLIPMKRFTLEEIEQFEQDRALARPFLETCLDAVDWSRYPIIGFTTTFEQNTASLAFARMVKERAPKSVILFGGANCEGEMGVQLQQSFPWIDFVCTGEGDDVVPQLVRQILGKTPWVALPGIAGARQDSPPPPKMVLDLDRLPIPDFSAYFARLDDSPIRTGLDAWLPVETSRGCWWGEKHHCTFCGLNGGNMRFRSKSSGRALEEITQIAHRHGGRTIGFTDNILDMKYLTTLLPALRDAGLGLSLFYETKSNLTKDQVRILAESGVRELQPGIESLHTSLLRLMRKGCTALQNLQVLRWCREFGVAPRWNLLFGFPGEDPTWFEEQTQTIRKIHHLTPPRNVSPVRLDRFSPYFAEPESHGISRVRPARALTYIYDLPSEDLARVAYHFDFDFDDGRDPTAYMGPVLAAVREWQGLEKERFFFALRWRGRLVLWDARRNDPGAVHVLGEKEGAIYEFCDRIRGRAEVSAWAARQGGLIEKETQRLLDEWTEAELMVEEQACVLALAVFAGSAVESRVALEDGAAAGPIDGHLARGRSPDRRPQRNASARAVDVEDDLIVLDRERGRILILDALASALWKRCDGKRSVRSILTQALGMPGAANGRAAGRVIDYLEEEGLLETPGGAT